MGLGDGRNSFPSDLFETGVSADAYLKYSVSQFILNLSLNTAGLSQQSDDEIEAFKQIRPHSVITTNYDVMLEDLLPDYTPVGREEIVVSGYSSVGEIVKIHGTVKQPETLVLTESDYLDFRQKRRYISAKLLTYFREHPILFVGYSAEDENIREILSDINEALTMPGEVVPNIYFLERASADSSPRQTEKLIRLNDESSLRVKCIQANDFSWAFETFSHRAPLQNVNPRVLRAILARSYHLVRSDIPRQKIEVDFDFIEGKVESDESFAQLFGISTLNSATELSTLYPYTLTDVARKLGGTYWYAAHKLILQIQSEKGIDIKASDNRYHMKIRLGKSSANKYSDDCVKLLRTVAKGAKYSVDIEN